jgi:very-short-patch-repair endonuclease
MSVIESLSRLGGVATRADLIRLTSRPDVDRALDVGDIVVLARGRYALPDVDEAIAAAHRLSGVVARRSAAMHWGWELKVVPPRPELILPRNRKLAPDRLKGVDLRRATLVAGDVVDGVTSKDRTLLDCLRHLAEDEGLTVADSALRHDYSPRRLALLARSARGPRTDRVRRIAGLARAEYGNVFESALRWIAVTVPGLHVEPQVAIREPHFLGRPDLVDVRLRILLEADSFEWHGKRAALRRDTQRYNTFVVHGWLVLRFAYEDVMFDPDWVRSILVAAVAERTVQPCAHCRAA